MAPAVVIDNTPDLDFATPTIKSSNRTLILAPPSVASHPDALTRVVEAYDRNATDIQMLDRLTLGLVLLPSSTYDTVLLLTEVDGVKNGTAPTIERALMERVVQSLKVGGRLRSQDGTFGKSPGTQKSEAILAGLEDDGGEGMIKPRPVEQQTVRLNFGKRKAAVDQTTPSTATVVKSTPQGVGFVDTADDMNDSYPDSDDDMEFPSNEELQAADKIDPDTLLTDADRQKPINIPEACKPASKRRRACKDCTCGLAERLAAEDQDKRANADATLAKLNASDLTEVDFTVQGKVGSCGNCALGDAFRCDGCPYIGLPAFKPGEEVRLLNNDIQL